MERSLSIFLFFFLFFRTLSVPEDIEFNPVQTSLSPNYMSRSSASNNRNSLPTNTNQTPHTSNFSLNPLPLYRTTSQIELQNCIQCQITNGNLECITVKSKATDSFHLYITTDHSKTNPCEDDYAIVDEHHFDFGIRMPQTNGEKIFLINSTELNLTLSNYQIQAAPFTLQILPASLSFSPFIDHVPFSTTLSLPPPHLPPSPFPSDPKSTPSSPTCLLESFFPTLNTYISPLSSFSSLSTPSSPPSPPRDSSCEITLKTLSTHKKDKYNLSQMGALITKAKEVFEWKGEGPLPVTVRAISQTKLVQKEDSTLFLILHSRLGVLRCYVKKNFEISSCVPESLELVLEQDAVSLPSFTPYFWILLFTFFFFLLSFRLCSKKKNENEFL